MTAKQWIATAVVASVLGSSGCVCCNHHASQLAVEAGPDCTVPLADRQHVYIFMVNGLALGNASGLEVLRDELGRHGFMKIGTGQTIHAAWMRKEMVRIKADDPAARFVLLGYDIGCTAVARLAAHAQVDGLPVDAVILLDPPLKFERSELTIPTLVIHSGRNRDPKTIIEGAIIPDAAHADLPAHPETVNSVVRMLGEVAMKVEHGSFVEPVVTSNYEHAPPQRIYTIPGPNSSPEWNFLLDTPGVHAERLAPVNAPQSVRVEP